MILFSLLKTLIVFLRLFSISIKMSKWHVIHQVHLNSHAGVESNSGYSALLRVLKLEDLRSTMLYVDIRQHYRSNPTRSGVCLSVEEFQWVIHRLKEKLPTGNLETNQRQLEMSKEGHSGIRIVLTKPGQEPKQVNVGRREIKELISKSDNINGVIDSFEDDIFSFTE